MIPKTLLSPIEHKMLLGYDNAKSMTIYEFIFWLQFLTKPFSFVLLRQQKLRPFTFSTILTLLTFLSFVCWAFRTYKFNATNEIPISNDVNFNNYLFHDSNTLEFFLFIFISILLILQCSILLRFVIARFQAKIT